MRALGIILENQYSNAKLGDLTSIRAASALPVGSCYRAIDFVLSNMSNSGMAKVAVITQYNSRSLQDHLSSSKWWDLGRKQGGLFVLTPFLQGDNPIWFRGTADFIYQNLSYLKRSNEAYAVIASGTSIFKMDFQELIEYHEQKNADITVMYQPVYSKNLENYDILELDQESRILNIEEKPMEPQSNNASMGIYLFPRTLLIKLVENIIQDNRYDIVRDILIRFRKKYNICGYPFQGYWNDVSNSIQDYFTANMDFLQPDVRKTFVNDYPYIATKPKDEPAVKYNYSANVKNSLIASGSIINGFVEHSVLFRRVVSGENSRIINSIVMEGSFIGNNCVVENAIIDKEVVLSDGKQIIGTQDNPVIIRKGTVL